MNRGYIHVHIHELLYAETGVITEEWVVYLKHTTVREFWFNGPMAQIMDNVHYITPGIDYNFPAELHDALSVNRSSVGM